MKKKRLNFDMFFENYLNLNVTKMFTSIRRL